MQFEVPQFIEMEDKIFGPLTWRQFVYLGGGVGFGVVLFLVTHWLIFIFIGIPIALIAIALAFVPINSRPFSFFLEAVYSYLTRHKLYVWKQEQENIYKQSFLPGKHPPTTPDRLPLQRSATSRQSVASLARRLEMNALQKK